MRFKSLFLIAVFSFCVGMFYANAAEVVLETENEAVNLQLTEEQERVFQGLSTKILKATDLYRPGIDSFASFKHVNKKSYETEDKKTKEIFEEATYSLTWEVTEQSQGSPAYCSMDVVYDLESGEVKYDLGQKLCVYVGVTLGTDPGEYSERVKWAKQKGRRSRSQKLPPLKISASEIIEMQRRNFQNSQPR